MKLTIATWSLPSLTLVECAAFSKALGIGALDVGLFGRPALDKAALLAEVGRFILLDTGYSEDAEGNWEDRTIELCIETRRTLLRHPRAAPLILQFFPRHLLLFAYEHAVKG